MARKKGTQTNTQGEAAGGGGCSLGRWEEMQNSLLTVSGERYRALGRSRGGRIYLSGRQCFLTITALRRLVVTSLSEESSQDWMTAEHRGMLQEQRIPAPSIKGLECVAKKEQSLKTH